MHAAKSQGRLHSCTGSSEHLFVAYWVSIKFHNLTQLLFIKGTRSKRRGLDESGACANYVETEQVSGTVIIIDSHLGTLNAKNTSL